MVRKLKHHESKLLKKVDFITWDIDNNVKEGAVIRRYQLKGREEYMAYNKLSRAVRTLTDAINELKPNDGHRITSSARLLEKLYTMGVIPSRQSIELAHNVTASAFCRRRLPVVMVRLKMAESVQMASQYVQQGHVRVGPNLVTDPAFLVTRSLEDFVTWTNGSKIRAHIQDYQDTRDDFDMLD